MKIAPWFYAGALLLNFVALGVFLWTVQRAALYNEFEPEWVFWFYGGWFLIMLVAAILVTMDVVILFRANNLNRLIRNMRILKLVMIPFFVINFLACAAVLIILTVGARGAGVLVIWVPVVATYILFLPTTFYGLAILLFAYRWHLISTGWFLAHLAGQLMFCIDMVSAYLLFAKFRDYPLTTASPQAHVTYPQGGVGPQPGRPPGGPASPAPGGPPPGPAPASPPSGPPPGSPPSGPPLGSPPSGPPPPGPPPGSPPSGSPPPGPPSASPPPVPKV